MWRQRQISATLLLWQLRLTGRLVTHKMQHASTEQWVTWAMGHSALRQHLHWRREIRPLWAMFSYMIRITRFLPESLQTLDLTRTTIPTKRKLQFPKCDDPNTSCIIAHITKTKVIIHDLRPLCTRCFNLIMMNISTKEKWVQILVESGIRRKKERKHFSVTIEWLRLQHTHLTWSVSLNFWRSFVQSWRRQ